MFEEKRELISHADRENARGGGILHTMIPDNSQPHNIILLLYVTYVKPVKYTTSMHSLHASALSLLCGSLPHTRTATLKLTHH